MSAMLNFPDGDRGERGTTGGMPADKGVPAGVTGSRTTLNESGVVQISRAGAARPIVLNLFPSVVEIVRLEVDWAAQLQNPREYGIDPALEAVNHSSISYHQENAYRPESSRLSLPGDGYGTSFAEDDSPILEGRSDEQDDVDSVNGNGGQKKTGRSSAANEVEMRQLLASNKHRTLPDVAKELHGNERGPNSERTRQIFAMLW